MPNYDTDDTITAVATGLGEAGIGIVRISGRKALEIADELFVSKDNKRPSVFETYSMHYGWIKQNTETIDEAILSVMRAPKSYTKEDIVEINCHGGIVPLRRVLNLVLEKGARLAFPGEFTKRAFLNGRIDLAQAEAVLDIIRAKTDSALKIGVEQLKGELSCSINKIRNDLLDMLFLLEANIDFPEEETEAAGLAGRLKKLGEINCALKALLDNSKRAKLFREGIHAVICGKPNVGKSSLLNALLREERSIVTAVAGTTRDTVEEVIDIKGIPLRIVDTAGILEPRDLIEKKAVRRSKRQIEQADLAIIMFDASCPLTSQDALLIKRLKKKQVIAVINKIDLRQKIEKEKIVKRFNCLIEISAKKLKNIHLLEEAIANLVYGGKIQQPESITVSNLRHIQALGESQKLIAQALSSLDNNLSLEFIAEDIKGALGYLDDLLGKRFSGELLDRLFAEFCIGK